MEVTLDSGRLIGLLTEVCQLFDGWKADEAWTPWDADVRRRVYGVMYDCLVQTGDPIVSQLPKPEDFRIPSL